MRSIPALSSSGAPAPLRTRASAVLVLSALLALLSLFPPPVLGGDPPQDPPAETDSFLSLGITFYQEVLAPVMASQCYMSPSCSRYSRQAFARYGPLLGLLLTIDRLFHEANEDQTSPLIREGKTFKLFDPPEANVWWKRD